MPRSDKGAARLIDDCFQHDRDRLRHDEALSLLKANLAPVVGIERVCLETAIGRITAETLTSRHPIPGNDNAAVDGYAFAHSSTATDGAQLQVIRRIAAGDPPGAELFAGQAVRIFTGAPMPPGADTVAMQEDCREDGNGNVTVPRGLKPGANRRRAGEDMAVGETIVSAGQTLRPQEMAAIASDGHAEILVHAPLRIALLSSGNELHRPGQALAPGQVHDFNFFLLRGLLASLSVEITDLGILPDDASAITQAIGTAARDHDAILTTGGASRGEEDHVVAALDKLGKRHLWQLAVKPGRPMCFGQIGDTLFFGLPGNPVAAFVCFLLYVRPALMRLGGGTWPQPARFKVAAGFSVAGKKPDRREFWRGWLEADGDGRLVAHKFERDGSGLITGLRQATGLIEIREETTSVDKGDAVDFIPFSQLGITGPTLR